MYNHALRIAHRYAARPASQGKPSFSGRIGSRELRHVGQIINVTNGTRSTDPPIYDGQTVDGERVVLSL